MASVSASIRERILSPQHRAVLERAIAAEVITERGYWTAIHWLELAGLGFRGTQKRPECFPALMIPQHDPTGEYTYSVLRWDTPRFLHEREVKYDQPAGVGLRLDVPLRCIAGLRDPDQPLWWTEGSKKADALASRGLVAVSTPGVDGWRSWHAIPDLFGIPFKDRLVYCAYDSDVLTQRCVRPSSLLPAGWDKKARPCRYWTGPA